MECFMCESEILPTLNTFIVLDIVIQMLKGCKGGSSRAEGGEKKKALYLTNKIMMEAFPPNFNFILAFLNGKVNHNTAKISQGEDLPNVVEGGTQPDERNGERNFVEHTTQWNIHKVKDIKKGTVERVTYFESPMKEHLSVEKFRQILERIHIKYIEGDEGENDEREMRHLQEKRLGEKTLTETLYNLNERKEYNWVIVNLAFLFVKDKKKINIYAENLSLHYLYEKTKDTCTDSLNTTKEILFSSQNTNNFRNIPTEREIYDVPFFNNILTVHFCYSFLVNFYEHLNHHQLEDTICNSVESHMGRTYRDTQCDMNKGEVPRGRSTYRPRGRTHDRNTESTDRVRTSDQCTIATILNSNNLEKHSISRKRKLEEIEGGELLSGSHSGTPLGDRERSTPEEGSTTDTAPNDGSEGEQYIHLEHPHVEHPHVDNLDNHQHLQNLPYLPNDDLSGEHISKNTKAHEEDFLNPRKRKKKKGNIKHLYTFDVIPKSEKYKKIYINMLSLYCNCICLIS
ncbi:conserved Plasmodium protein, unknown function [Plasmodium knowlesi strain H]|uniref:Uncharacterized protein n=3 Tax=Plasmodium knowlesi TaxID=5850 RepID=A0A5K1UMJ9_PLAKH|nr:conserved Plasmodium protein, unknown function [Plasmodium knowlesi strain H]OTN65240.1 Uncharacterized protein PKNOH_S120148100 [Plasmodium knowlesi]CAA9988338.1 conserved Plasmodium protein, unknown function [Plasmodium knowlesi strain H]SBO20118.1 conserved Plasmodium protein, unknown function [Plasmodium knowlesi strain H]SBO20291.1 conserved Plasmodium protein, unknown function [Plasmodium knowlesi strain H]VVS77812.1 conserved Plasmodium protein, unknown function [Plasmodium knowlesi |eukprot:XP_002259317.1 hypothetical protein, conserved in Plasmodium species [Plasmodium knowlesi strain H]